MLFLLSFDDDSVVKLRSNSHVQIALALEAYVLQDELSRGLICEGLALYGVTLCECIIVRFEVGKHVEVSVGAISVHYLQAVDGYRMRLRALISEIVISRIGRGEENYILSVRRRSEGAILHRHAAVPKRAVIKSEIRRTSGTLWQACPSGGTRATNE